MTVLTRVSNGKSVSLGKQIASSGEGEVWETNESGILAKIYHSPTRDRIEKLKVMLANPPADPMKSQNHVSIAFPQDLLKNGSGTYVGFLMPAIGQSRELTTVYNPSLRRRKAPGFNWYYLHATALNTAWIIQSIHEKGYILGDIKPQNILVNDRALVAVIDTDSFQVHDSQTGKVYRCTVGSEGFTPVELLGKDFSTTDQTETCDRFRLAVLIHYLLFGYHPFSGQWVGSGDSPEQNELIRNGFWYGSQNSLIRPSLNTIPLDVVHPEIKQCFLKCFNDGHTSPHLRPTAEDWHNALEVAVNDLTVCGKVDSHHYSQTYGKCYWCERAAKLSVDIFPFVPSIPTVIKLTITQPTVIQIPSSTPINQASKATVLQPFTNPLPTIQASQQQPQTVSATTFSLQFNNTLKKILLVGGASLLLGAGYKYLQFHSAQSFCRVIQIYPNGDRYEGEFRDDKSNGLGVYKFANGNRYEGEFQKGKFNGKGVYKFTNGNRYEGEFKNDKFSGNGVFIFANGVRYEGEFYNGKYNGQGILKFTNGNSYEGQFQNDKSNGKGVFTFAKGDRYEGAFRNGKFNGQGIYKFANGNHYRGEFKNDKFNGKGKL